MTATLVKIICGGDQGRCGRTIGTFQPYLPGVVLYSEVTYTKDKVAKTLLGRTPATQAYSLKKLGTVVLWARCPTAHHRREFAGRDVVAAIQSFRALCGPARPTPAPRVVVARRPEGDP